MELRGTRALVTGASSGIGWELAKRLGTAGAELAVAARRLDRLETLAAEIAQAGGSRPVVVQADLSQPGAAVLLAREAAARLGAVDLLVNNAATGIYGVMARAGDAPEARIVIETNLWSPLALIAEIGTAMRERGRGRIVNVTSLAQVSSFPGLGIYCASKAALGIATETLRLEMARAGVGVTEVVLGPIRTPGSDYSREIPGAHRWLEATPMPAAEQAAAAIVRAIVTDRDRIVFPRRLAPFYALPGLSRRFSRRVARGARPDAEVLRLAGT